MNTTELMAYWVMEREAMRLRKGLATSEVHAQRFAGLGAVECTTSGTPVQFKYGYSDDIHMGTVRYCNVRREDDKVTRWLAAHWRPNHHTAWELTLARMVNYIPTLRAIIGSISTDYPIEDVAEEMKKRRAGRHKLWTSAYTISTCGKSMDKIDYAMGVVDAVKLMEELSTRDFTTLAYAHRWLMQVDGLGSFLAAQVVADMKNTNGHQLQHATDFYTWSAHGPGSLRGLSAYFGKPITPRAYAEAIDLCWREVRLLLPVNLQDLHMQDFQNCLCEFSKYTRIRGGGHARNRYPSR